MEDTKLTQTGLLSYAVIFAETFPILFDLQSDEVFFSPREQEILHHVLRKKTTQQITDTVSLPYHTVQYHIDNIKTKMHLTPQSNFVEKVVTRLMSMGFYPEPTTA